MPVDGNAMTVENIRFRGIDEFLDLSAQSDGTFEYTVSWVDCAAAGGALGRGIFSRANHSADVLESPRQRPAVPVTPGFSLINRLTVSAFNWLYYHRQFTARSHDRSHYRSFLYPLDGVRDWNRVYGRRGFLQYQFVVPSAVGREVLHDVLTAVSRSGMASTLAVLKVCGDTDSPGLLSFPMPGVSLAMDFPNRGRDTLELFERLDAIIDEAGGRLYPAKDAHMRAAHFQAWYPAWAQLEARRDPAITSSFWQRVTGT
jgi:FAD/FMN-containing dehydrogenase